jgi:hypothetical protein
VLDAHKPHVVPGCYTAPSAHLPEDAGFEVIYMPGYGTSLGLPDAGLATLTEMALNAKMMASAVRVSVIAATNTGDPLRGGVHPLGRQCCCHLTGEPTISRPRRWRRMNRTSVRAACGGRVTKISHHGLMTVLHG